jgi:hypothetical protein
VDFSSAQKSRGKKEPKKKITQLELQSELMSFADRYSMIIGQASEDFLDKMQKNPK